MNDGQRLYPVDKLILHHSMGPTFANASDLEVQDWFSDIGKNRAYQGGAINPYHEHPGRPGQLTYAQAQFAGIPDSSNKYNYRIVTLIARPWENVAWHASNWGFNQTSVGLENCGDYRYMYLEDRQLMCIADWYREVDQKLGGATSVWGHQEVTGASTECPANIMEQRDKLVDMINNPDKWNKILWVDEAKLKAEAEAAAKLAKEQADRLAAQEAARKAAELKAEQDAIAAEKARVEAEKALQDKLAKEAKEAADKKAAEEAMEKAKQDEIDIDKVLDDIIKQREKDNAKVEAQKSKISKAISAILKLINLIINKLRSRK